MPQLEQQNQQENLEASKLANPNDVSLEEGLNSLENDPIKAAKDFLMDVNKVEKIANSHDNMEKENRPIDDAINLVKDDNVFMKSLIEKYLTVKDHNSRATVLYLAVYHANFEDNDLFKKVFETDNQEPTRYFALTKITDENTLKDIANTLKYNRKNTYSHENGKVKEGYFDVVSYDGDYDDKYETKLGVLLNIKDENYLKNLIQDEGADIKMRLKAIEKINDIGFLQNYVTEGNKVENSDIKIREFNDGKYVSLFGTRDENGRKKMLGIMAERRIKEIQK